MSVYPLLKNWTESGVTWNRYDGTNNWQTAGAGGATDRDSTSMGSRSFVSSEPVGFKAIPLDVSTMQSYVNGTRANYGWLLKMDTESGYLYEFTTSDRYIVANRPQLVVEYTLPEEEPDWINKAYTYEDADHIHAVTSLVVTDENNNQTTNSYRYDANGNMTCRIEGGETFLQAYNAENRMSSVGLMSGNCDTTGDLLKAWQFTYDGDGVKVKQEYTDSSGTITTYYYMGGSYEVQTDGTTETVRQYYAIAGVTAGMREGSTFYYFLTDHLGSVVGVMDSTGTLVSETRYLPFGEIRTDVGTVSQTDYGYTFQKNDSSMGLMDYKARYYSSLLGRFVQSDSIIPGAGNPQAFNRYAYTSNNPVKYTDPSGHMAQVDDGGGCEGYWECLVEIPTIGAKPKTTIPIGLLPINQAKSLPWKMETVIPEKPSGTQELIKNKPPENNPVYSNSNKNINNHANMFGIAWSGTNQDSEISGSIELLFGGVNAIYLNGSAGAAIGKNINLHVYIGEVFNIDSAEEYLDIYDVKGVTLAYGLYGMSAGYGRTEYSGGPESLFFGWAPGVGVSYWKSIPLNTWYHDFGGKE